MPNKQISMNAYATVFTPSAIRPNKYPMPNTLNNMLTLLPQLVNASDLDIPALQSAIETKLHPGLREHGLPAMHFSKRIIHMHGPSASGKSTLARRLQSDLGGPSKACIIERDSYIQKSLDGYNRKNRTALSVSQLYDESGKIHSWAFHQIFKPADNAMQHEISKAHSTGKFVIWDTMKELDKHMDLSDTVVIRMVTRCLDLPETRDFETLATRHDMSPSKQRQLASIVFPEKIYNTKLENGEKSPVLFNALYGWSSGERTVEIKAFYDLTVGLLRTPS